MQSVRVEQADLFGTDPKYRYRPLWSVGAGWLMTRESFLNDIALVGYVETTCNLWYYG